MVWLQAQYRAPFWKPFTVASPPPPPPPSPPVVPTPVTSYPCAHTVSTSPTDADLHVPLTPRSPEPPYPAAQCFISKIPALVSPPLYALPGLSPRVMAALCVADITCDLMWVPAHGFLGHRVLET